MAFNKEELQKIKSGLPASANRELADRFNLKLGSIRNILSGLSNNDEVVLAAFEMAEAHQSKLNFVKRKLKQS